MDRRMAGALLLAGALIALVCAPAVVGRHVGGIATTTPVPPPPQRGSCLTSIAGASDPSTVSSPADQLPTAVVGSCRGVLVGEVVSVDPTGATGHESGASGAQAVVEGPVGSGEACADSTVAFVGLPFPRTIAGIRWTPGLATGSQEIGPDLRQRAVGQRWSACVVTGATASYRGSIGASATGGLIPDSLGLCWPETVKMDAEPTSCSTPHTSQLLATGVVDGSTSVLAASLASSCRQFATAVLDGMDPGAATRLVVRVAAQGTGPQILLCSVSATGRGQLSGSILGIGHRPLPLTG